MVRAVENIFVLGVCAVGSGPLKDYHGLYEFVICRSFGHWSGGNFGGGEGANPI